jgi:hypothetical protein
VNPHRIPSGQTCGAPEHALHRRLFLQGTLAAGGCGLASFGGLFTAPALADQVARRGKKCLLLWLCGAPSQFETWDPKPGRRSGGPFAAIPTSVPGVHISELMPECARRLDRLALVRSMHTEPTEHFQGIDALTRGDLPRPPFTRPVLGSVVARLLGNLESPVPQFVLLDPCPEGNEFKQFKSGDWPGWLGPEVAPVRAGGEFRIPHSIRPDLVDELDHQDRETLRAFLSRRFQNQTGSAAAGSHNATFERVRGLMHSAPLFDLERLPEADRQRYGPGAFAQHVLLARHLLEQGSTFVMVANGMPWDCHVLNHEIHQLLVPELDHVLAVLLDDLRERGTWDDTLVIAMGEFGRTPWLNDARGRDHYPAAWSLALAGGAIRGGSVYGATDADGVQVAENPVDQRRLFATIFTALGLDPHAEYDLPGLPTFSRVEGNAPPIRELLA